MPPRREVDIEGDVDAHALMAMVPVTHEVPDRVSLIFPLTDTMTDT